MAKRVLNVIETAYRATVEEQDDTILWLAHMLKNAGMDETVLLRSNAVNYAVRGQDATGLRIGGEAIAHAPRIDEDVSALLHAGVPVYYVNEDAEERGIPFEHVIEGAKPVPRRELPVMFDGFDLVLHW